MLIPNTLTVIRLFKKKRYKNSLNVAVPSGMWQNAQEIICDDNDREYLRKIERI